MQRACSLPMIMAIREAKIIVASAIRNIIVIKKCCSTYLKNSLEKYHIPEITVWITTRMQNGGFLLVWSGKGAKPYRYYLLLFFPLVGGGGRAFLRGEL